MRTCALVLLLLPSLGGCDLMRGMGSDHTGGRGAPPSSPRVSLVEARLTRHPTDRQLASHFCTEVEPGARLGPAGLAACRALGAAPSNEDLQFRWEIELEITNGNPVSLPLVEALIALTPFPDDADAQSLGTICLSLCESDTACAQTEAPAACDSDEPEIIALDSLGEATPGLLTSVALAEERFSDLRVRTLSPRATVRLVVELLIDRERMLTIIGRGNQSAVQQARQGEVPDFDIPYAVEGSVWVQARSYGRVGGSFLRTSGTWDLSEGAD